MAYLLLAAGLYLTVVMLVIVVYWPEMRKLWHEPVVCHPVLIIESDDWGAGPLAQADALARLSALLHGVRDRSGRPAVMTLGIVLEVPDGARIAATGVTEYHPLKLTDTRFEAVRAAIKDGIAAGVFEPQLHGQSHYWPPALLAVAQDDSTVRVWLTDPEPAPTEDLPSHLQSSWVDASSLPSRALAPETIRQAAAHEAADYKSVFGSAPQVAVATTFVWRDIVEVAWAQAGIEVIITPGCRATCRNAAGQPACVDITMLTGGRSHAGETYLVRDVYFEPALGHVPQRLVDGLLARTHQGRACLVETHRFNFLQALDTSLAALEAGLNAALKACPDVRFLSPLELSRAIQNRDPAWIENRLKLRLVAWRARLDEIPHFRRVAQMTGLVLPLALLGRLA